MWGNCESCGNCKNYETWDCETLPKLPTIPIVPNLHSKQKHYTPLFFLKFRRLIKYCYICDN